MWREFKKEQVCTLPIWSVLQDNEQVGSDEAKGAKFCSRFTLGRSVGMRLAIGILRFGRFLLL